MPTSKKYARACETVARLTLSIHRIFAWELFGAKKFGSCADETLLCAAIIVGQAEGKPMTALKLADYVGIPRPTVIRKLKALAVRGVVEIRHGRATMPLDRLHAMNTVEANKAVRKIIHGAAMQLSKMDTLLVVIAAVAQYSLAIDGHSGGLLNDSWTFC